MTIYSVLTAGGRIKNFKNKEEAVKFHQFFLSEIQEVETFEPEENFDFCDGKTFAEIIKGE